MLGMCWRVLVGLLFCGALGLHGQVISEIRIHTEPADARVRPFENVELQVCVYGSAGNQEGRLRRDGATVAVTDSGGGWVSKPFRFQGEDTEGFIDQYQTRAGRIFGQISGEYVLQDGFLYTAPEEPGQYVIRAELEGHRAEATIIVDRDAPSLRAAETITFDPEPATLDPYRDLVEHYAPFIAQETWFQPKSDYAARFNYDGDWAGDDNWEDLETGSSQAYVHYAVAETPTHWFLIYNIFHPRDYSDKCVVGTCHENDNEGLILTIAKDGSAYGRPQAMETLAHNNIYSFVADSRVRGNVHNIEGMIEFHEDSHPVVFIEAGGHGVYGTRSSHARYDVERGEFTESTGVTYVYTGVAERPRHANDRMVGYDLLPIYFEWWSKTSPSTGWSERTFDDYFTYQPLGGRPRASLDPIGGAFLGRTNGSNNAKPFWGWHDNRTNRRDVLAVGQWGLDPAYSVSRNLRFPGNFSTDYLFNPYLALPSPASRSGVPAPSIPAPPQPSVAGSVEFSLWVDHIVDVRVSGNRVDFQLIGGAPFRDATYGFSRPLPSRPLQSLQAFKLQGRGNVELVSQPSASNGWTAIVRIEDTQRAGDTYRIRLEWTE